MSVMRCGWRTSVLVGALCTTALTAQQPEPVRAFVEVDGPVTAYVQQPVVLTVRLSYDVDWLREYGVPLFRQRLDEPFFVDVPWLLGAADRAVTVLRPRFDGETAQIAVGDRVLPALRLPPVHREGRTFAQLELQLRWLPLSAGTSIVAPVELRYAYATGFTDDLLRGRQPIDKREARVTSAVRELHVRRLPQPAPPGFAGAVGEFEVHATSGGEQVEVGQSFAVELIVTGDGNLERFAPLPAPELDGFHVQGVTEERQQAGRTFRLDVLALRAGASELPPIPFVAFSPARERYVTLLAEAVPVRVVPPTDESLLPERVRELVAVDRELQRRAAQWPWWTWFLLGFALFAIVRLVLLLRLARGERSRLQSDFDAVRAAVDGGGDAAAVGAAFERLLLRAARIDAFDLQAVVAALRTVGIGDDVVQRVQLTHEALHAARFGGPMPAGNEVLAVADDVMALAR